MLKKTFIHVPRVGEKTELKLWKKGILSWEDYLRKSEHLNFGREAKLSIDRYIENSLEALKSGDAQFFEKLLPPREIWRIYPEFREKTCFLDIETTGLGGPTDYITMIGLFDGREIKTFIKGKNLEDFLKEIRNYSVIVTYNGKCFDIPFIESEFTEIRFTQAHIDLRYLLHRLGYSGGLKQVERDVGIQREKELKDIDGYMAVILWRKYLEGDERALHALTRYNIEDIVNLKYLIEFAYNRLIESFPIPIDYLEAEQKIRIDIPFDPSIVEEIKDGIESFYRFR